MNGNRIFPKSPGSRNAAILTTLAALGLTSCNGNPDLGNLSPTGAASVASVPVPSSNTGGSGGGGNTVPTPPSTVSPFKSCAPSDSSNDCLSLKYVVYENSSGKPYADEKLAEQNTQFINALWNQCQIAFQVDEYLAVDPRDYGLDSGSGAEGELNTIRRTFQDSSTILLITTGPWSGSVVGWTNMPGSGVYGAVVSSTVTDYPVLMAHELGHYLGLGHTSDASNLMNPVIYSTSTKLTASQCNAAKSTIQSYWSRMLQ